MWAQVVWATKVRGCIMAIWAISLRRSCLPPIALPCTRHLGVLAGEARRRGLAAGVGVDLRVQHEHLDVHAAGQQPRQRLEADVEHGAVAADAPDRLVLPAHLVPAHAARRWRRPGRSRTASWSTAPGTDYTDRSRCRPCCSRWRRRCPTGRRTSSRWRRTSSAAPSPRRSRRRSRPRRRRCASAP